jgi:aminoglycoside phosphotransferase (APT) family kinase protein
MLARLHAAADREEVAADDARLAAWFESVDGWFEELERLGVLGAEDRDRAARRTRLERPARATWGLQHGDFCGENLVVTDAGLCCVDNTTLGPGLLESDLAQTFYRWPMDGPTRRRFLAGYARHASPDSFLADEPYWRAAGALRAAAFRGREGAGPVDVPLRELARHVR